MKGICFKEQMFHRIISGEKTQTRRVIFPDTDYSFWSQPSFEGMETDPEDVYKLDKDREIIYYKDGEPKLVKLKGTYGLFEGDQFYFDNCCIRPRYQPDEILFLKEPYFIWEPEHCDGMSDRFAYKYGISDQSEEFRQNEFEMGYATYYWHNKLFMPAKYARYFIQIKDVNVQRLNDITKEDAIAEGFDTIENFNRYWIYINGVDSLKENPFVFVYTFTLLKQKPKGNGI